MSDHIVVPDIPRVVLADPLTPTQLTLAMFAAQGFPDDEIARLMGVTLMTMRTHLSRAGAKIPGDLSLRDRVVVWYRGGSLQLLGGGNGRLSKSQSLRVAYRLSVSQGCPHCGHLPAHDAEAESQERR